MPPLFATHKYKEAPELFIINEFRASIEVVPGGFEPHNLYAYNQKVIFYESVFRTIFE